MKSSLLIDSDYIVINYIIMDPKKFQNDFVRKRFTRANVHETFPTLSFICSFMEKHVKKDQRKEDHYNLVRLIENMSELNNPMESLSENDKGLVEAKANAAIEDSYKTRWSKNKDAKEYLQAHQNEYSDPRKDTWMLKNGKWDIKYDD